MKGDHGQLSVDKVAGTSDRGPGGSKVKGFLEGIERCPRNIFHLLIINYLDNHVFYTTFMFKYNYYLVYSDFLIWYILILIF